MLFNFYDINTFDRKRAENLFIDAQKGNAQAQYELARIHFFGSGIIEGLCKTQAAFWLNEAAEHGHTDAQFSLGMAYLHSGDGNGQHIMFPYDIEKAVYWLRKSGRTSIDTSKP